MRCLKFVASTEKARKQINGNATNCDGSDVVAASACSHVSGKRVGCDGVWRHGWCTMLCYRFKTHRGIDAMLALGFVLCSWINKAKDRQLPPTLMSLPMTLRLCKSTRWSVLALKCAQTKEVNEVRYFTRFLKLCCVCPMQETPQKYVSLQRT